MYDFEGLVDEILRNRPELTREALMGLIEEKKSTVGAGYLTSQGALFLIAGELKVPLEQQGSSDLRLKDLYAGANDVTVVARVLAVYPVSVFDRKDGGQGKYERLMLFDKDRVVKLTLWEERLGDVDGHDLSPDTPVRVVSGYVKQGLDGKPELSLGKRGRLEFVAQEAIAEKLPTLETVTERLPHLSEQRSFAAVDGIVSSEPRYSEFVRTDGTPGSLFQFGMARQKGDRAESRVVIWTPASKPDVKVGQTVRVTNVKSRKSSRGDYEIHGDAGSVVSVLAEAKRTELRVAAAVRTAGKLLLLSLDAEKNVLVVEAPPDLESLDQGVVIRVLPDSENGGRLICSTPGSLEVSKSSDLPRLEDLATKVKDAKREGSCIMTEVISLSQGTVEDVHFTDGNVAKKGELIVGDDTGEMKFVAWRSLSDRVTGIEPGARLRLVGVVPKMTKLGAWVLEATASTVIERISAA